MNDPLKLPRKTLALIVAISLLLPLLISATPKAEASNTTFFDDFEGTTVDTAKWAVQKNTNLSGYPAYGGAIKVSEGDLYLSSDGSTFPWISTIEDPFPATGDFSVTFNVTYTCIGDWGDGVVIVRHTMILKTHIKIECYTLGG